MAKPRYEVLLAGNNLKLEGGFLGLSSVTLIHCQGGPILVDTGGYVTRPALIEALAARGLAPADVPVVFLTHLHFDHAHNIDLFTNARILVSRREWDYARAPHPQDLFMPWGLHAQLERQGVELFDGGGQIAPGVESFPAPGHTPGLYALMLDTDAHGPVCIASDAIKYPKEAITRRCDLAFDTIEAGTETIGRILDTAERIVPGHFVELRRDTHGFTWDDAARFSLLVR